MDWKSRLSNYGLWLAVSALIPLLAESLGFKLPANYNDIINSILAIMVLLGIINDPTTKNHGLLDDATKSIKVGIQTPKNIK